jgi:hypothetical protein
VRDLTKADVVLRTAASDAALSEPGAPAQSTPTPPALPGVLTQDVRDRLAKHNQKILGMVKQGDQIAVTYFVALDFSVAGLLAGRLAEQVKPHRDRNSFTFTFKRIAEKKWQELDKQPASSRCPAGKTHFKYLFGAMNARCVFSTK